MTFDERIARQLGSLVLQLLKQEQQIEAMTDALAKERAPKAEESANGNVTMGAGVGPS